MSPALLANLPHRDPFRFLSAVEELEPARRGVGSWLLRGDEDFFRGHFPGNPVVPGVLLAEALAQLSGLVAFAGDARDDSAPARLAQVSVKFQSGVVPPAKVRLESSLTKQMGGLYLFDVRAEAGGVVVASGTLMLAKAPADSARQGEHP